MTGLSVRPFRHRQYIRRREDNVPQNEIGYNVPYGDQRPEECFRDIVKQADIRKVSGNASATQRYHANAVCGGHTQFQPKLMTYPARAETPCED